MHKSSLLEIIRTLTPKELIKFEDFVNSPYFNKNKNVINLFIEIKKYAPEFNDENLEKEKVWQKLFPGKNYNYGIMKNIIHDLSKLSESFLTQEIYNNKELQRNLDFLESIFDRNIKKYFEIKYETIEKSFKNNFEKKKIKFTGEYYYQQKILTDFYESFLHNNSTQTKNKISIIPSSEYLIYAFLIESFKMFHKVIGHSLQYNHPLNENILYNFLVKLDEDKIIQEVLKYTKDKQSESYLILKCYYNMFRALRLNDNFENFKEFKDSISLLTNILPKFEIRDLYFTSMTCLTNLKITLKDFSKEYFEVILLCNNNKVLVNEDGTISPHLFLSIVNMACSRMELTFIENFISEHTPKLPDDFREGHYNYAMATLNFAKKNFNESLEYLAKIKNEGMRMKYHTKNMQLDIFYELDDRESFEYAFDSLKHFSRKNKLSNESRILVLIKYCGYLKAMFKLKDKFNSFEFDSLKKEIELNKVGNKAWLLRKLDELKE